MKPLLLVAGLLPYESGKTTFVISTLKKAKNMGFSILPFKPVSAHSIFTQFYSFIESERRNYLIGNDALQYEKAADLSGEEILFVNPIDFLLSPLDPPSKTSEKELEKYREWMEDQFKMIALMRLTKCEKKETLHYVFEENLERFPKTFRERIESFAKSVGAEKKELREVLEFLSSTEVDRELDFCLEAVMRKGEGIIAESFSDSLYPYSGLLKRIDSLVIVAPGKVYAYLNGKSIIDFISSGKFPYLTPRSKNLLKYLEPDFEEELKLEDPLQEGSILLKKLIEEPQKRSYSQ